MAVRQPTIVVGRQHKGQKMFGRLIGLAILGASGWMVSAGAQASSPAEKIICTQAPRNQWMSEAKMREIFGEKNFTLVKFKVSHGNCYEFYAVHHDGSIVEAYYHPVTGDLVRYNRVTVQAGASGYESRTASPAK